MLGKNGVWDKGDGECVHFSLKQGGQSSPPGESPLSQTRCEE